MIRRASNSTTTFYVEYSFMILFVAAVGVISYYSDAIIEEIPFLFSILGYTIACLLVVLVSVHALRLK